MTTSLRRQGRRFVALALLTACAASGASRVETLGAEPAPQSAPRLLVTDHSALDLAPNLGSFGAPLGNSAGDVAWVSASSAVFLRRASDGAIVRVFQMGDAVPDVVESVADVITAHAINDAAAVAFDVIFATPDATNIRAIVRRDPDGALTLVARGGGSDFSTVTLVGVNDAGAVAFSAIPQGAPTNLGPTVFLASGPGAIRLAGPGDTVPGVTGTLNAIFPLAFNNAGEVLFRAALTGGPAGTGLFVTSSAGTRKAVMAGDASPAGPIPSVATGFLNDTGDVAFTAAGNVWRHTPGTGLQAIAVGVMPAPGGIGGNALNFAATGFNNAGQAVMTATIIGSPQTTQAVLRSTPASPLQLVAFRNQAIPGGGRVFLTFPTVLLHEEGTVSFIATLSGTGAAVSGLFRRSLPAATTTVALLGDAAPPPGVGAFGNMTVPSALAGGQTAFRAALLDGTAVEGIFLGGSDGLQTVATTNDALPEGARVSLRNAFVMGQRGDFAVFRASYAGGRGSLWRASISSGDLVRVAGEGDEAPGTSGGRFSLLTNTTVVSVNAGGQVAFLGSLVGGTPRIGAGIFVMEAPGSLRKVAATNDPVPGTTRTIATTTLPIGKPTALNDLGQIVFRATFTGAPASNGILFYQGGTVSKLVATTESAPGGGAFAALNGPTLSQAGQMAVTATVTLPSGGSRSRVYLLQPGVAPLRLAEEGQAAPGGGVFESAFPTVLSLNSSGHVVFKARVSGGSGGVFVASAAAGLQSIARHGEATPVGGTHDFVTVLDGQALINDAGDVAFRTDVAGADADSAYIIRRGADGSMIAAASEGQAAPEGGEFQTISRSINNILAEQFDLDDRGNLLFATSFAEGEISRFGTFLFGADGMLSRLLARGDVLTAADGGLVLASAAQMVMSTGAARHVAWVRMTRGSAAEAMTVLDMRFRQSIAFAPLADRFLGDPPFELGASATSGLPVTFTAAGSCTVTDAQVTLTAPGACTLTATQEGDETFAPATPVSRTFHVLHTWSGFLPPFSAGEARTAKRGSTVPVKFQLTGVSATLGPIDARLFVAPVTESGVGPERPATSKNDAGNVFRIDSASGQYHYNLNTGDLSVGTWVIRVDLGDGASHRIALLTIR